MSQAASAPTMCSWLTGPSYQAAPPLPSCLVRSGLPFSWVLGLPLLPPIFSSAWTTRSALRSKWSRFRVSPCSGVIPKVGSVDAELSDPRSGLAEAYRSLATALQFTTENGLPRTLVITSSGPSEGKSLTSMAIAKHFATIGRRVLLLDGDLRNPSLHLKLNRDNSVGLSNYLTGACAPPQVMQTTDLPNLAFIASGPLPPNAADLLGSARRPLVTLDRARGFRSHRHRWTAGHGFG